jgi:hypothetical protein
MSVAPDESASVSISLSLNVGRKTQPLATYYLNRDHTLSGTAVDELIRRILIEFPEVLKCKNPNRA